MKNNKNDKPLRLEPYAPLPNANALLQASRIIINLNPTKRGHSEKINIYHVENSETNGFVYEIANGTKTTVIEVLDIYGFASEKGRRTNRSGLLKVWIFVQQKLMQEMLITPDMNKIRIDLNELVEIGMYTCADTAYKAIEDMVKKMSKFGVYEENHNKTNNRKISFNPILFSKCERKHGNAYIAVDPQIVKNIKMPYTYFPLWAYCLKGDAFALTEYVFRLIRLNAKEMTEKGFFSIKISTVCNQIGLKTVEEIRDCYNRKYKQLLINPFYKAINEINKVAMTDETVEGKFVIDIDEIKNIELGDWLEKSIKICADRKYIENLFKLVEKNKMRKNERNDN